MLMPMVSVTNEDLADGHDLFCHLKPCGCPWPMLPPRVMMVSVAYATAAVRVDGYGICYYRRPCCSVVNANAGNHVEAHVSGSSYWWRARKLLLQWYQWLAVDNEGQRTPVGQPILQTHPNSPSNNNLDWNPSKRIFKTVIRMLKYSC